MTSWESSNAADEQAAEHVHKTRAGKLCAAKDPVLVDRSSLLRIGP
jgi:hypothetical protein